MRIVRNVVGIIATVGLMAGSATMVGAQEESDPLAPAYVTGRLIVVSETNDALVDIADELVRSTWDELARLEIDDARLSGVWKAQAGINRYRFDEDVWESAAEAFTGNVEVRNDGGAWTGTLLGCCDDNATMVELVGTGGYEGLSALLYSTADGSGILPIDGVIVPGDLVLDLRAE